MSDIRKWQTLLSEWISTDAMPLWTGAGIDEATGTVWEALDLQGSPLKLRERRLRVQARQVYCFAKSSQVDHQKLAISLFRFLMSEGFDGETGNLAATFSADMQIVNAPNDLYDLAFMLLAASALIEAGFEIEADLEGLLRALEKLKASRGWYGNAIKSLPRRQNPHMHLFEASVALFAATSEARFLKIADECLDLFNDVFLSKCGKVLEFFDHNFSPYPEEGQVVEPGHMAEWIYLLDRYEVVTGRSCGVSLEQIFESVLEQRDEFGLLPDRTEPCVALTRRLWPQTELLKAVAVINRRRSSRYEAVSLEAILSEFWSQYLIADVKGGWVDQRSTDGLVVSKDMPASTFYHVLVAIECLCSMSQCHDEGARSERLASAE